jgi:hypothetical protein
MPINRERLAQLLGMLGSDHDGEVLNAARLAAREVRNAGATWPQLLAEDRIAVEAARQLLLENEDLRKEIARLHAAGAFRPRPPQPWEGSQSASEAIDNLLLWEEHLSPWEIQFLNSLLRRSGRFTPRQREVLASVGKKVDRCIRSSWEAA